MSQAADHYASTKSIFTQEDFDIYYKKYKAHFNKLTKKELVEILAWDEVLYLAKRRKLNE